MSILYTLLVHKQDIFPCVFQDAFTGHARLSKRLLNESNLIYQHLLLFILFLYKGCDEFWLLHQLRPILLYRISKEFYKNLNSSKNFSTCLFNLSRKKRKGG